VRKIGGRYTQVQNKARWKHVKYRIGNTVSRFFSRPVYVLTMQCVDESVVY
jgi:hypothetical protein